MSADERPKIWTAEDSDKCECVLEVMQDDVLLGRGSGPNDHVGNIKFRDLVAERKSQYLSTNHRQTKALIAKDIVDQVYARGGRFLKKLSTAEAAKVLPELSPSSAVGNSEDGSGQIDVYQIQKHSIVMEKAKQALRQNQRNTSPERPDIKGEPSARRNSAGHTSESPRNSLMMNGGNNGNNFNAMGMGNMQSSFNDNGARFQGGNDLRDTFEMQNSNNLRSQESYQQQLLQQQQYLLELQQQHDLLQMQFEQRQRQHSMQQREMETHNKLLQEQLQLQIRQEQLRLLQQRSLQSIAKYRDQQPQQEPDHTSSQSNPPAVLDGYATYTTTLDAMEDSRHNSSDAPDDKSLQMSTMMGSFKDMSVKDGEDQSMSQSIGTIEGVGIPSGLSTVHMSGMSMMSMMNDSTDSLFKNPQKAGNDVGAKNASWGNNSSSGPLADVIESQNPAAVAAAAVLGRPVPGFTKAERRWSGGFIPTEVQQQTTQRRRNRRGSLQYTPNNADTSNQNASQDLNQMQTMASAMLAMAQREQEQNFNYINTPNNYNNNSNNMSFNGQGMMNQGYHMDGMNGGYRN